MSAKDEKTVGGNEFAKLSCAEFSRALFSKEPVPGGGGVSALVGALSASLCGMVGNLTIGKKKYADVEEEIRIEISRADALRESLLSLIQADAEAFYPLSVAYGIKAQSEEEKEEKANRLEECLRDAAHVPYRIMCKIKETADCILVFAKKGSRLAVSDAGVAAALAGAAVKSADLNVRINTKLMKDRTYAAKLNQACDALLEETTALCDEIYQMVAAELKN